MICRIERNLFRAFLFYFAIFLSILFASTSAYACDNTLMLLLIGDTAEESIGRKLVHISGEMQKTADLALSFNHAAAAELHQEVLNKWLYVASEMTSNPPVSVIEKTQFMSLLTRISRELGHIRRMIGQKELETVHYHLELSVARMSLLSALLTNAQPNIQHFIQFEVALFAARPAPGPGQNLDEPEFIAHIIRLDLPSDEDIQDAADSLTQAFTAFDSAKTSNNDLKGRLKYQEVYNSHVKLKQNLLDKGFFNEQPLKNK